MAISSASIELHQAERVSSVWPEDAFKEDDRIVAGRTKAMSTVLKRARAGRGVSVVYFIFLFYSHGKNPMPPIFREKRFLSSIGRKPS
jgi:hypothetical protein